MQMTLAEMWTYTVHELIFLTYAFINLLLTILVGKMANLQKQIHKIFLKLSRKLFSHKPILCVHSQPEPKQRDVFSIKN